MMVNACLAYSDIKMEVSQLQRVYLLTIRTVDNDTIYLTLNYTQARLLIEGVGAFLGQTPVQTLMDGKINVLFGDANWQVDKPDYTFTKQKGAEKLCQLPNLFVRTDRAS